MNPVFDENKPPLFYVSPITLPGKPLRGGIPILFPQFADKGPLRKHGFARDEKWTTLESTQTEKGFLQVDGLDIKPTDWPGWAHAVSLRWRVEKNGNQISFTLSIRNSGNTTFEWTGGLHPYFSVSSLHHIQLLGLGGEPVSDKLNPKMETELAQGPVFDGQEFERLYHSSEPVTLVDQVHGTRLKISQFGFTEWMVWNPGMQLGQQIPDLPPADWSSFICIEPVVVSQPKVLHPDEQFTGGIRVECLTSTFKPA